MYGVSGESSDNIESYRMASIIIRFRYINDIRGGNKAYTAHITDERRRLLDPSMQKERRGLGGGGVVAASRRRSRNCGFIIGNVWTLFSNIITARYDFRVIRRSDTVCDANHNKKMFERESGICTCKM